ncbi:protein of unknown function [Taphrina deformans PYCC 5710]|uniref:Zinc-regulated transporter 1 n=1 Tax=Taphrina deformans (strain PYCC 5710 / ATCC 11124 / CBS 356.35 / IMI 108563 / JCM 9778 / NBRC 8474) TaxID=1097556 RepID=R4XEE0_TAPDE|nr:protein of unknown function [Taphrina deformans PYCC 5710]|eukprot:CCG84037.1 protein of unknown function [Taphrina deformans PYCC 5710]
MDAADIGSLRLDDDTLTLAQKICYLNGVTSGGDNEYDGHMGVRISSLFVILVLSSMATFFPVMARRVRWLRIPLFVYLFVRYFGAGVIVATAFIHLLDPAYSEIGPNTCVGLTGGWSSYSFVPAIVLVTVMVIFCMDLGAKVYVERKYGLGDDHASHNPEHLITDQQDGVHTHNGHIHDAHSSTAGDIALAPVAETGPESTPPTGHSDKSNGEYVASASPRTSSEDYSKTDELQIKQSFEQQIAAFYILEFGVIFHSIIIGLNLAVSGWDDFKVLYIVIIFHQSFEGLGIGARMSMIPFPRHLKMMPWLLCAAYGLTTPLAIAIGLGVRTAYNPESFTASIVSGVLDSISAGILIYTGLVELLAADFLFNPQRTKNTKRLLFMLGSVALGAGLMALLGKWA